MEGGGWRGCHHFRGDSGNRFPLIRLAMEAIPTSFFTDFAACPSRSLPFAEPLIETLKHLVTHLIGIIQLGPSRLVQIRLRLSDVEMVLRLTHFPFGATDGFEVDVGVSAAPTLRKDCRSRI